MTPEDYRAEYAYRMSERLGMIIGGPRKPTDEEEAQARREVAEDMDRLEEQEKKGTK